MHRKRRIRRDLKTKLKQNLLTMKRVLQSKIAWLFMMLMVVIAVSCDEDTPDTPEGEDPIASFQYAIGDPDWNEVTFTNYSQNAVTYSWDFGDGTTSTDENPVHTYATAGDYTIVLVASNEAGTTSTFDEDITLDDPNVLLGILAGEVSKKWIIQREGVALGIGEAPNNNGWWSFGGDLLGDRPCVLDDEYTFTREGLGFQNDTKGTFFLDSEANGGWDNALGPDLCHDETEAGIFTSVEGVDLSALANGGDYTFDFNPTTSMLTLNGAGVYIGLINKTNTGDLGTTNSPATSLTYEVLNLVDGDGVDSLTLSMNVNSGEAFWNFYLVHYEDESETPAIPDPVVIGPCEPLASISPTEISHTFASNEAADWELMQLATSGSGLEYGVDDPTDATADKVGKYIRIADVQYQELQFKLDPANAINFENLSTITMEVYLPSTNAFDEATLTDNVFIGFGATTCPPDWWTDQHEYQELDIAKDTWVTISFDLTAPDYVGNTGNGVTVMDRNDLDMIYIAIGGSGHTVGGEFYIRNFVIE